MEHEHRELPEALSSLPSDPSQLEQLAERESQLGNAADAIELYRRTLEIDPTRRRALVRLAELCEAEDRVQLALDTCVQLLKRDPGFAAAHMTAGLIFSSLLRPETRGQLAPSKRDQLAARAAAHLKQAATLEPSAESLEAWGRGLMYAGKYAAALGQLERAIELDSQYAPAYEDLGQCWLELGKIETACEHFRKALLLDAESCESHYELARLKDSESAAAANQVLPELLQQTGLPPQKRMMFHFALAHRLDAVGKYDEAFEHFVRANSEKDVRAAMPADAMRQLTERTIRVIDSAFVSQAPTGGSNSELPIFIVGMPRSGTTLVEQILASHPNVFGAGELYDIPDLVKSLPQRLGESCSYPESLARIDDRIAKQMAEAYLTHVRHLIAASPDSRSDQVVRATDKMPTNSEHLGLIALLFPKARIVHVRRDPRDICVSCFKQNLHWPFCNLEAAGNYYRQHQRLMAHWHAVLPVQIHEIEYEQLVKTPEQESQRLVEFCGLPWNEACLQFAQSDRAIRTPSKGQVRQPIHQQSVGTWKRYEEFLGPLIEALEK